MWVWGVEIAISLHGSSRTHVLPRQIDCEKSRRSEDPTTNGGTRTGSSVGICTTQCMHVFFCTFGTDLYAQLVLSNKTSASELSRKFIESALLVGEEVKKKEFFPDFFPSSSHRKFSRRFFFTLNLGRKRRFRNRGFWWQNHLFFPQKNPPKIYSFFCWLNKQHKIKLGGQKGGSNTEG